MNVAGVDDTDDSTAMLPPSGTPATQQDDPVLSLLSDDGSTTLETGRDDTPEIARDRHGIPVTVVHRTPHGSRDDVWTVIHELEQTYDVCRRSVSHQYTHLLAVC